MKPNKTSRRPPWNLHVDFHFSSDIHGFSSFAPQLDQTLIGFQVSHTDLSQSLDGFSRLQYEGLLDLP